MKSRIIVKLIGFGLSASMLFSLTSCDSVKRSLAGELTDFGISIESVSPGSVYIPESGECETTDHPYYTVYNNCLFVGNSVMCDFYSAVVSWRKGDPSLFEKSYFFCNQNFGVYENNYTEVSSSSTHPSLVIGDEEIKCTVEDAVEKTKAKMVVFCLAGVNDLPVYGDEENCQVKTASDMGKLISALKNRFPQITVAVLSTPYISSSAAHMKSLNNEKIKLLNEELSSVCVENGADFIDMQTLISDENGALKAEYCADNYCRINESGCKVILASLKYYAGMKKGEI